ncbi:MAG: L,D-transpeptidase family protein [Candidatus Macondimonas sp.]
MLILLHAAHASGLETLAAEPAKAQRLQGVQLWNAEAVDRLYADREDQSLWVAAGQPRPALANLVRVLDDLHTHGLNPDDYHLKTLQRYINQPHGNLLSPEQQFQLERQATDAFLTLATHMATGRAHPAVRKARQISLDALPQLTRLLVDAVDMNQVAASLTPHPADPAIYSGLQAALIRWERASNLPPLPMGPSLRPGDRNERIEALRDRLAAWEKLAAERPPAQVPADDPQYFDEALAQRVADFQRQMGLDHDAIAGPQTIAALNTSRAARLDQLRANLERQRWPAPSDSDGLIRVNLPDFTLSAIRDGQEVWRTRVIVGRQYRPTPLLSGAIDTIVFNPTWEVPRRLVKEDLLPKMRADPGFLEREGMTLYRRTAKGRIPVDPAILTQNASAEGPVTDLRIRQAAGARNALGRIKFLFPNNEQVYLHDTPSKQLFERTRRMFSSGCIRVETPLTLARFLMESQPDWTEQRMEQIIGNGKTRSVRIKPVPIQFVYWTAWPDPESGVLHFREDIYQSDQPLARALEQTPWN